MVIKGYLEPTKENYDRIMLSEGYSQVAIDSLWEDRPPEIDQEGLNEVSIRMASREMKSKHPEWATRSK